METKGKGKWRVYFRQGRRNGLISGLDFLTAFIFFTGYAGEMDEIKIFRAGDRVRFNNLSKSSYLHGQWTRVTA